MASQEFDFLGLFIHHQNPVLQMLLNGYSEIDKKILDFRISQLKFKGFKINKQMVLKFAKRRQISTSILEQAMFHYDLVSNLSDARQAVTSIDVKSFLGVMPNHILPPSNVDAIKIISRFGGIPILAHPFRYKGSFPYLRIPFNLRQLKRAGLKGVEIQHIDNTKTQRAVLSAIARLLRLEAYGGIDLHAPVANKVAKWATFKQRKQVRNHVMRRLKQ